MSIEHVATHQPERVEEKILREGCSTLSTRVDWKGGEVRPGACHNDTRIKRYSRSDQLRSRVVGMIGWWTRLKSRCCSGVTCRTCEG